MPCFTTANHSLPVVPRGLVRMNRADEVGTSPVAPTYWIVTLFDARLISGAATVSDTAWELAAAQLPSAETGKETVKFTEPTPVIVTIPFASMLATLLSLLAYANTPVELAVFDMPASSGNEKAASPSLTVSELVVTLMDVGAGTTVSSTVWELAAAQLPSSEAGKETVKVT